ncbi:hypothetical protein [Haliangium ochraceum]|uniref:PilZ domain-containing protein n=1 Tax=Haliangium ochraceum (strain DSM 14365 / JCM 11303 / SMP-2) TaxID=502025 RepID=D0LYB6_HALO1|nr:hypothetical protein [Haliangium ochraceum]ACY16266.1 hypothetical protein Hoch_3766 [Haliangium ochraceum DSM 14365]
MKEVEVHFASARDVLGAYWGHLTGGGLAISRHHLSEEVCEGQTVSLQVCVDRQHRGDIIGTVIRTSPTKAIVAFSADDGKRELFTVAFSECCSASDVRLLVADSDGNEVNLQATLAQLSDAGCCVTLAAGDEALDEISLGSNVTVILGDSSENLRITGCVMAQWGALRWILFDLENDALPALRRHLDQIARSPVPQAQMDSAPTPA